MEKDTLIVVRTKEIESFFSGKVKYENFMDGKYWYVSTDTFSGGSESPSILDIIYFRSTTKEGLIEQIKTFSEDCGYIFEMKEFEKEEQTTELKKYKSIVD